jgi:iron complex outermembrane recepter protein
MNRVFLTAAVSCLALTVSAQAMAQTETAASPAPQDSAAEANAGDEDSIIVTAQRRNENLMRTAISATVLSGGDLENKGVTNVDALQFVTPSLVVNNFGQGNDFNIRGIGKAEHNTQTTTGVITYRDGAPTFPGYITQEPYFDIANVQILRGPQGTIVGQNATGGAVLVNTRDPVIGGGVSGYIQGQIGSYENFGLQGAVNLPVSDTFAARVALFGETRNGFYKIRGPGGTKYSGDNGDMRLLVGRLSLLWKPTPNLTITSKTDLDYLDQGAYPASRYDHPGDLFNITANAPMKARDKFFRQILKGEYVFNSGIKLRSVSSYAKGNTYYRTDLDGTASEVGNNWSFFDDVDERQMSQEFNLISPDEQRFTWLVGAFGIWNKYYFKKPYQFVIDTNFPLPDDNPFKPFYVYSLQGTNPTRSLALFGQVGFEITPSLKLEVGGRYTESRSTNHVDVQQYGTYIRTDQTAKSDNFSYKVSLGWEASPEHFLYAFVATGFRPGGLNVPVGAAALDPFGPEKVQSLEAGWKGNFLDGRLRTTVNGFYNRYRDFQVIIGYPLLPVFGIEVNVPEITEMYGAEAQVELRLGGFKLDTGVSFLHSSLGQFYATDPRAAGATTCDPETGPVSPSCIDLDGRDQTYAPNFTFNIGAEYRFDFANGDSLTPRVNFGHVAEQWATLFQNRSRGDRLEARNILNAQLAYNHDSWTVTAFGSNLTDQHYPGALNSNLYFAGPPRQYGVKVLKTF